MRYLVEMNRVSTETFFKRQHRNVRQHPTAACPHFNHPTGTAHIHKPPESYGKFHINTTTDTNTKQFQQLP